TDYGLFPNLLLEMRLPEHAAGLVVPSGDGEQSVDTTVRRTVGVPHEPRLAHRPARRDERRNGVGCIHLVRKGHLRIHGRARPTDFGLKMTTATTIQVHPRAEALVGAIRLCEIS